MISDSKKLIAFDLDGTLAASKQPLEQPVAEALIKLLDQKKVAVISGGSMDQFRFQFLPYFEQAARTKNVHLENLWLLPVSGTEEYQYDPETKGWSLKDQVVFPEDDKKAALEALDEMVTSGLYDIPKHSFGPIIEDRGSQITFSALGQQAPLELKKTWDPDQRKRLAMKSFFESRVSNATVSLGGMTSLDIVPKEFTKAVGLERLLERLGLEKSDLLYMGDALFPGGNDYSVVEGGMDALKVTGPDDTVAKIKSLVHSLESDDDTLARLMNYVENRPWGQFRQFTHNARSTVKVITVQPNQSLSLQSHKGHAEFWYVLSGTGAATVGNGTFEASRESMYQIPVGTKHRMAAGPEGIEFLEIAFGTFDEHDIVRYEDDYGRI